MNIQNARSKSSESLFFGYLENHDGVPFHTVRIEFLILSFGKIAAARKPVFHRVRVFSGNSDSPSDAVLIAASLRYHQIRSCF